MKSAIKTIALVLLLGLVAPWSCLGDQEASHLAIVASLDGESIKVKRFTQNDLESPAKMGMMLFDKDTVITPAGASCSLMFNTGDLVKVAPNSRLTVNMRPADSKSLVSISRKLAAAFFTEDPNEDTLAAIGGVRAVDKDMPILLFPKESMIVTERPTFQWSEIPGAQSYCVTLTDSEGNVWTREGITATQIEYPSDFPVLAPGTSYFWQADAVLSQTKKFSDTGTFEIAGEDVKREIREIESNLTGEENSQEKHFIMAMVYQKHNMMHEAIKEYLELIEIAWTFAYPHEQLGAIYVKLGWKEKALQALEKAVELDPGNLTTRELLAKLYDALGEKEKAQMQHAILDRMAAAGAQKTQ